ncbi:DUF5916 domain-containing protein [Candidatus Neomarinimicrobiota bacterium]
MKIDGLLDEPVWHSAPTGTNFISRSPMDGVEPSFNTTFKILYDNENLYVGIRAYDNEPDQIIGNLTRKDEYTISDWLYVSIDSFNDNRTAFEFGLNAAGVQHDLVRSDDVESDDTWDGVWDGEVNIDGEGWTAEFSIPFRELRFSSEENMNWGLQIRREFPRNNNEESVWSYWSQEDAGFVSNYGEMNGFSNIKSAHPFYFSPYIVNQTAASKDLITAIHPEQFDNDLVLGADFRYSFLNGLTLNGSINPDFGQVEADPGEYNLTANESYFSEKRPLFMEGANILQYSLGFGGAMNNLFYSRRIGRNPQGYAQPNGIPVSIDAPDQTSIIGAGKITGKTEGGMTIGLLNVTTSEEQAVIHYDADSNTKQTIEPLTNYFVSRMRQDYNEGRTIIGGIVTAVNRRLNKTGLDWLHNSAYTYGIDLNTEFADRNYRLSSAFAVSHVTGSSDAILRTQTSSVRYFQRPDADHLEVDSSATSLSGHFLKLYLQKIKGNWQGAIGVIGRSPGLEVNDIGFLGQVDNVNTYFNMSYNNWEPKSIFRDYHVNLHQNLNFTYGREFKNTNTTLDFSSTLKNNWFFNVFNTFGHMAMLPDYLRGGPSVAGFNFMNGGLNIRTDERKSLVLGLQPSFFINNEDVLQLMLTPEVEFRYKRNLILALSVDLMDYSDTWVWVGSGEDSQGEPHYFFSGFDQKNIVPTMRLEYTMTKNLTFQYYGQLYLTAGNYRDYKEMVDFKTRDLNKRFKEIQDHEITSTGSVYTINYGADDSIEFPTIGGYNDFNYKQYRSNLVLRWEYKGGSSIYLVWSTGFTNYEPLGKFEFNRDTKKLFDTNRNDVIMLKVNYLLNR